MRHVGSSKRAFRTRMLALESTFSYEFSNETQLATSKSMFRAKVPSILITCHKMPRLPSSANAATTWRSPDNAICKNKQNHTSKALRLPRNMTAEVSKVKVIFRKRCKSTALVTQKDFWHVLKHVAPATRNEVGRRLTHPKVTTFATLPIGTAKGASHGQQRIVANGCGWLQAVADACERSWMVAQCLANTPSLPKPPECNGNPCYAVGKIVN